MKKYILSLVVILITGFMFTSCENELNIAKLGNLGAEEEFYKTDADAEAAITTCYKDLGGMGGLFEFLMIPDNLLSGDIWCGGGQKNDDAAREDIGAYTFSSTNKLVQDLYEGLYKLIYHSNLMIEKFDAYDTDIKKRNQAEAYFFRGMAHFYLGAYFGTTPIVDHLLANNEYNQPNSTKTALFEQAASDLKKAVDSGCLTTKNNLTDPTVRVTKEAAQAYLGKTYVFLEKWSEAAQALNSVVASKKYELYSDLNKLFHTATDYCPEYILEWNAVADYNDAFAQLWHLYFMYHGFRGEFFNWTPKGEAADLSNSGYGFFNPTKDLYDAYVAEEGVDGYRLNHSIKTYEQIKAMGISLLDGKVLHGHEGYWDWKHRFLNSDYIIFGGMAVVNYCFMRYSEVLLLAAEANLKDGNETEALKCLNEVRKRAQLPAKSSISMDIIKIEKRLELFGDGCRWMDLVRWGDAATELKDQGKVIKGFNGTAVVEEYKNSGSSGFVAGKHEVLPIPATQITLNDNMVQNPGW